MTLQTSYKLAPATKSSKNIDLLKEPILLRIGIEHDDLPSGLSNAVTVFGFEGVKDECAVLSDGRGSKTEAFEAPLCILAVLINPSHRGREQRLLDWLQSRGIVDEPLILEWRQGSEIETAGLLIRKLASMLVADARRIAKSNRELLSLRTLNDNLQNRFAAVESFVDRKGMQPFELAFSNDPVRSSSRTNVLADASYEGVSQILPVASSGVSAIAIHFDRVPSRDEATLIAELVTLEDMSMVESWSIPVSKLKQGWNYLGLTRTLAGLRRTLSLRIQIEGADDELPILSLGGLQPLEMFQVRDAGNDVPILKNSIALQVWCGMPGVVLPNWANYLPAQSDKVREGGFREFPVQPSILDLATLANTDEISFEFAAILPLPDEKAVGCHPPSIGVTIGQIPGACPPKILRISSDAVVDNEESQDVEFAMVIAASLESARELFAEDREAAIGEGFSGWINVSPKEPGRVSTFINEQIGVWQNIYFATRMKNPGDNNFAWAKFRNISLMVNG
ncbi:hypothetical protein M8997_012415 [Phyllobacterium sp. 21LDTY02-6]|uniref:DUF6212 domain-containing protein n=1 Tax=unclassified Phyllobacterium TaxID=2638441 RepID=UPI0020207DB9|nr:MULTISPECIES: DUF6212 domain-containing protein [unclassified Phyllobacterium]MCO4317987.1 hypothetical protein [Phyllobacterium sp. 21LDTY02-6]MCX8282168.1 DUF6212 domain-containing protein [Phyllobacterium sp. 0TCS1.6C]MCX8296376.1 DUF6212 domain-containing protein [Phyllobacterium sp. 0TCS1.6A]